MALQSKISKPPTRSVSEHSPDAALCDLRFRALLPDDDWKRLPQATRQRFSKRLADGRTAIYVGEVIEVSFSRIGWWLAQIARLIGGPLPISTDTHVPSIVTVTEDAATSGQVWTRIYARRSGFPQVIHSSKRFAGPTGLEEYLGFGLGMALRIVVDGQDLLFRSAGYFVQAGYLKFSLPAFLTPGALTVTHTDRGGGEFQFALEIVHPRFGMLVRQSAVFREATP
ncbi:DUF4166 domain-containing protein [Bradyrhizobium sp.]